MIVLPLTKNNLVRGQSNAHLVLKTKGKEGQAIDAEPKRELFYVTKETRTFQI